MLGFQLVVTSLRYFVPSGAIEDTATLLRITAAAGLLVLVHNLYGQASPASRSSIRLAMLALSLTWSYDLNLYTIAYLDSRLAPDLIDWRGLVDCGDRADVRARRPIAKKAGASGCRARRRSSRSPCSRSALISP